MRNAKKLDSEIQMSQDPLNQLESIFLCIIFHPRLVIGIALERIPLKKTLSNFFSKQKLDTSLVFRFEELLVQR